MDRTEKPMGCPKPIRRAGPLFTVLELSLYRVEFIVLELVEYIFSN